jgi:O-succinylbenzoic acid--CoA ligase
VRVEFSPWLTQAAERDPDGVAVVDRAGDTTWAQLEEAAGAAADELAARGVGAGAHVAVVLEPGIDFVVALHACLCVGAVAVPVDTRLTAGERGAHCAGVASVVDAPLPTRGPPRVARPFGLDEIATAVHTSGTSAAPRKVEQTYGNWLWSALGSAVALGLRRDDRWLCALPLAHVGGLSVVLRGAIYGTTVVLHERFDEDRVLAELNNPAGPTMVSLVPTTLTRLLDAGLRAPPSLRCALVGGAPVPAALVDRARAAGVPVSATYGLTEACSQVATVPPGWADQSAAPPLFGTRLRIDDDGEILVAGPTVAPGAVGPDGWLHTGDLGRLDERGRLTPVGRSAHTIITGGENVAPEEVEAALAEHPAVAEAAVAGIPDSEWGEVVVANVVLRPGVLAEPAELQDFCRRRLAAFKVPKRIVVVDEIPQTISGKVLRKRFVY